MPEISLTGQIIERLRKVFGNKVGIYHSKFSHNEQAEIWQKVRKGEYNVVIGPRSAVFLPVPDLSLIIVDEEHDTSYKQFDPAPRYQARDTAIYRGVKTGAKVMLGTATPSLESYYNAQRGKYGLVSLMERYRGMEMPEVDIVDLRDEVRKNKMKTHFSSVLLDQLVAALDKNEQVILFQNRRGFSPFVMCDECGWIPYCTNCDVSLTYHKFSNDLRCHLCGYRKSMIKECGNCQSTALSVKGFGTEKIEDEIKLLYPKARVQRMDQDTVRTKEGHLKLISKFEQGEIDILVGTQMVTKGLDFDNVSLIGVLSADQLLNYPDFRANERAFQLMAQVSGRSGRKYRKGKVIIQAYSSDHPVLMDVKNHDMQTFYEKGRG
ncbi:MAG: primosomal protein N' [Bacteroidetes bacterium SW_11_45_7]|nr:MAG: primosomal protein N' [Bacteroidetes bacterium SW_11_45_7]